ncbi:MAG TPA: tetratricopeptide repeat protein [Gemmatimonadales bacterium]|nr:tetratricopeptide repeat protein [Gemmatimonadales bacterium]
MPPQPDSIVRLALSPDQQAGIKRVIGRTGETLELRLVTSPAVLGARRRAHGDFAGAEPLLRQALALAQSAQPRDDRSLAIALNQLGLLCKDLGRWDEARTCYERALNLLDGDPAAELDDIATIWHNLGGIAHARGDFAAGETAARRGLAIRESAGSGPRLIAADRAALAPILDGLQRYEEAERLYWDAIIVFEGDPGAEHDLAVALGGLGAQYASRGRHAAAVELLARAVELKRRALGPRHPDTGLTLHNLAVARHRSGDVAGAAAAAGEAVAILEASLEPDHPRLIACRAHGTSLTSGPDAHRRQRRPARA